MVKTKHASNSPVTFVTHKSFAVLFFLPSCCVNSLLFRYKYNKQDVKRKLNSCSAIGHLLVAEKFPLAYQGTDCVIKLCKKNYILWNLPIGPVITFNSSVTNTLLTLIIKTDPKSLAKIKQRHLTKTKALHYGLSLLKTVSQLPEGVHNNGTWLNDKDWSSLSWTTRWDFYLDSWAELFKAGLR